MFKKYSVIFIFSFLFASSSQALNLELTQGVTHQLPIAVLPFAGPKNLTDNISEVIRYDLSHSGPFKVVKAHLHAIPTQVKQIALRDWQKRQVDDVVLGEVKAISASQSRVRFALVNVAQNQRKVLADQTYTVNNAQLRRFAHHISDVIYEKLTGIRGVFSTRIAYVLFKTIDGRRHYNLQIADMDGNNAQTLLSSPQPIMSPAWSHDGKRIAYVSFENQLPRIYIQTISTGQRELVSSYSGINGAPAWSPDDQALALALSKDTASPKIYILNLRNKKLQQLTFGPSIDTEPYFSKDGKKLLFTSDRGGSPQIYALNLHSKQIQRLTFDGDYNARASLTPDNKSLVVLNQEQGEYNIAVQLLGEDNGLQILTHSGNDTSPSVAPNGQIILYESKANQREILSMVSIDGQAHWQVPITNGDVQDPAWSTF